MKISLKSTIVLFVSLGLVASLAFAQSDRDIQARGIKLKEDYNAGKVDGMRILILKSEGGSFTPVDPGRVFRNGDEIRLSFESNFDGFAYVINVAPDGNKRVLYPSSKMANGSNTIRARQRVELPPTAFIFDAQTGTEILQVVMSREPIPVLDTAIKSSNGELQSASSAAGELATANQRGGISSGEASSVLPQNAGFRARGIFLAQGKDRDKTGSVVAIADDKGANGRLKSGEVAVFEIRLQHN
jgi:hypothetical protein